VKRLILVILVAVLPLALIGAYDQMWGARLDLNLEFPEITGSSAAVATTQGAAVWYDGSWGPQANLEIDGGAVLNGDFVLGLDTSLNFAYLGYAYELYPVLDNLNVFGQVGMFGYRAGRQVLSDPAGLIIDAPMDGVTGSADLGAHIITAGLGFTGLAFGTSAQYALTRSDTQRDGILSTPRLVEYLEWSMPAVTEGLGLSASIIAMQDLSSDDDLSDYGTDAFHPIYLEVAARGLLAESYLYNVALVGLYGAYGDTTVLGALGRAGFSWFTKPNSRLGLEVTASTGDDWSGRSEYVLGSTGESTLNQYLPASIVSSQGYVVEFEVGNLASLGLFYASRPRESYSWELRTTTFLRPVDGPVSSGLVSQTSPDGAFLGQEALMSFFWRPRSDFGWDLKFGVLYAGAPIELDSELEEYYFDTVPVLFRLGFDWSWSF